MSEQVVIDGELSLDSAFDGLPNEQIIVNVTGAPKIIDKASGKIVSIVDGAENERLLSAVVNIEPVQDLNGYDYPWPGGGRTNKLNANKATSKVESQITWTVNSDESIAVKGTASSQTDFYFYGGNGVYESLGVPTGTYTLTAFSSNATPSSGFQLLLVDNGGTVTGGNLYATTVSYTVAIDSTKTYRLFLRVQNGTVVDKTLRLQLESGSSASAWTPYSNICPISGWSEVNVYADGKNMWPLLNSYSKDSSGTLINNVAADLPAGHYVVSCSGSISNQAQFSFRRENGTNIATCTLSDSFKVGDRYMREVTLSEPVKKIFFYSNAAINISDIQMELTAGTTSTGYETPNIRPITTALGQTVYGAREDVLAGKMTVDYGIATLDTSSITGTISTSGWYFGYTFPSPMDVNGVTSTSAFDGIASACKPAQQGINWVNTTDATIGYWYAAQALRIKDGAADQSLDGYRARYNGMQVVYKLATPIEVDLTPQAIKTLKGTNNIWADAGSMEVEYVADTKLYIQRLTAPTEDDMIANENIASGKFFMVGNDLYLSTSAIVAGETIVPGTNCTKLSLAEALNNINA